MCELFLLFMCLMLTHEVGIGQGYASWTQNWVGEAGLLRLFQVMGYGTLDLSEDCGVGRIMSVSSPSWTGL